MPYANNQGVRIHYEVEGKGPPLVLHHGFGMSGAHSGEIVHRFGMVQECVDSLVW